MNSTMVAWQNTNIISVRIIDIMIAKIISVKGRVQRIGYREYVLDNARKLMLKGYIKNELDNSVTIFIQGNTDSINRFIDIISNPPEPIIVKSIDIKEASINEELKTFKIEYGQLAEELQEGFKSMESIFSSGFDDYIEEFRSFVSEFRDFANRTDNNFNDLKNEMKGFREETR